MVAKVANHVCDELRVVATHRVNHLELFLWSQDGGSGTGKSRVMKHIKDDLFEKVLHWNFGVEFKIAALQAVVADLLSGYTFHLDLVLQASGRAIAKRPMRKLESRWTSRNGCCSGTF